MPGNGRLLGLTIRIPDRVLVFKYFARFLSPRGTWNFKPAARQYPISHSGWRSDEPRGSIDCALSSPKTRSAVQVPGGAAAVAYSGPLAPSLKAACTASSRDAQNLRPEKVELIYLRPQDIVAWTIMLDPRSNSRQISVTVLLGKVPRSLEHQHAQHREGGRSQARLGDVPPVLDAGRATSAVCPTAVMHAGHGRQALVGRGPGVSSG